LKELQANSKLAGTMAFLPKMPLVMAIFVQAAS
jgi:hypothetical protein